MISQGPTVQPPGAPRSQRQAHQQGYLDVPRNVGMGMWWEERGKWGQSLEQLWTQEAQSQGPGLKPPSRWIVWAADGKKSSGELRAKVREQRVSSTHPSPGRVPSLHPCWNSGPSASLRRCPQ